MRLPPPSSNAELAGGADRPPSSRDELAGGQTPPLARALSSRGVGSVPPTPTHSISNFQQPKRLGPTSYPCFCLELNFQNTLGNVNWLESVARGLHVATTAPSPRVVRSATLPTSSRRRATCSAPTLGGRLACFHILICVRCH